MPELPDVVVYIERLEARVLGEPLERIRLASPWVLRTFDPPVSAVEGKEVTGFRRIGKRILIRVLLSQIIRWITERVLTIRVG